MRLCHQRSIDVAGSLETVGAPLPVTSGGITQRHGEVDQQIGLLLPLRLQRIRSASQRHRPLVVAEERIVMEQQTIELGVKTEILVDIQQQLATGRIPGREAQILPLGGGAGTAVGDIGVVRPHVVGHHRHPGEHLDPGTGLELPGHPVEEIRLDRHMTVGEIERLRHPVAVVIGIGLQIDGGDAVTLDPIQQHVDVLVHLLRILVVDIVQIHVHQALHLPLPGIAPHDLVQGFEAGVLLQQIAAHRAARVTQLVEPFRQGEGVGHPRRTGQLQRRLVEGAVGPDQDPWCPTGLLPELAG